MEELFDTFDKNGNFLGVQTKSFCHSENPGCYHKPVWIWIVNGGGKILVQKRALTKKQNPGKWDMPSAGHVDAGETCLEACVRETQEELGLNFKQKDFIFLKEYRFEKGWELAQVYLLKTDKNIKDMTLPKEEVAEVKWLSYDEFIKLFYSPQFCSFTNEYKDWVAKILKSTTK